MQKQEDSDLIGQAELIFTWENFSHVSTYSTFRKGEELYKRSAFVLITFVLYTILYVCMLQFTK